MNEAKCSLSELKMSKGLDSVEDGQESNVEPRKQKKIKRQDQKNSEIVRV